MLSKHWANGGVRFFKSPRPLQICFNIDDYQGDGLVKLTIGLLYNSFQITIPFNGSNFSYRCNWKLFN